jgi:hypothetical protein
MKCVVKKWNGDMPNVFVPRKIKAEEYLEELFEKEKVILGDYIRYAFMKDTKNYAVIETDESKIEFFVIKMVEVRP